MARQYNLNIFETFVSQTFHVASFSGVTTIGTTGASPRPDILIQGTGVEQEHCTIENSSGLVTLYPIAKLCSVDGLPVDRPTILSQGKSMKHK